MKSADNSSALFYAKSCWNIYAIQLVLFVLNHLLIATEPLLEFNGPLCANYLLSII